MKITFNPLRWIGLALVALTFSTLQAQTTSPYSKFGYGLLSDNATTAQRQMGGVGYAMRNGRTVNVMNPASYAGADSMTFLFDIGTDVTLMWRKDNDGFQREWGGGIYNVTMLFPVAKRLGMSLGLVPYSSVGYSFGNTIDNGATSHQGNGGFNQLYLGAGYMPFKGFSLGFNVSYLFGKTYNDVYAFTTTSKTSLFEQVMEVRDYHLQFGIQYGFNIGEKNRVSAGLTFSPKKSLLGHAFVQKYEVNNGAAVNPDTVAWENLKGNFSLPDTWGAGLSYEWDDRLYGEVDFTYQNWADAKYTAMENFSAARLCDRYRIGAGASYVPNKRGSYLKRAQYRAGGYFNRDYIMVGDSHVHEWGVGVGIGLPAMGSRTMINVGLEYKHRAATVANLLKEDYLNMTIGINFNQAWFYQSKIR